MYEDAPPRESLSVRQPREMRRCSWAEDDPLLRAYHDEEWGVPERDSRKLWETLMLEGFQAGLSWTIILRKREAFRNAFKGFNPALVARFGKADVARLLEDPGIVRSQAKIEATIAGAPHLSCDAGCRRRLLDLRLGHRRGKADSEHRPRARSHSAL